MKKNPEIKKLLETLDNKLTQEQYIFTLCIDGKLIEKRQSTQVDGRAVVHNVIFHIRSK